MELARQRQCALQESRVASEECLLAAAATENFERMKAECQHFEIQHDQKSAEAKKMEDHLTARVKNLCDEVANTKHSELVAEEGQQVVEECSAKNAAELQNAIAREHATAKAEHAISVECQNLRVECMQQLQNHEEALVKRDHYIQELRSAEEEATAKREKAVFAECQKLRAECKQQLQSQEEALVK